MIDGQTMKRRRGATLDAAILDAAWAELSSCGYTDFTFESVARRAATSRTVIYRRWDTRIGLATAAIAHHLRQNPLSVPDLGNVREELCLLLRRFADRAPPRLTRLLFEMGDDMVRANDSFLHERFREHPLSGIVARAVERGEIDPARLSPRVLKVPASLVVHEIVVTARPITDDAIAEIVDQIFLPLVRPRDVEARSTI